MSFGYVVRPKADQDIDDVGDYLAQEAGLDFGLQFLAELYGTFALLASQSEMGWRCNVAHPQLANVRTFQVSSRFHKYLIFYQAYENRIEILRVLHGSQDLLALFKREGVE